MAQKTEDPTMSPAAAARPAETLETVLRGARIADPVIAGKDGALHAFVPAGFQLAALPDATRLAPWPVARIEVDDRQSLIAYANRFSVPGRSKIIADFDAGEITARLDWHPDNDAPDFLTAGPDKHAVTLKLRHSEEFARWDEMEGELMPQAQFARFLEENAADIHTPDPTTMIEISRDFEATVGQTYKSVIRLDNGDRKINFTNETNVTNGIVIPQKFTLAIPIYNGEEPDILTALFRWRPDGGGSVKLGFNWHRVEYQRRAHFAQIAATASEETGLPVFMGRQKG